MTTPNDASAGLRPAAGARVRYPPIRALRVAKPRACGCGRPVSFDVDKHEFFCIRCGAAKLCVCRRSPLTSIVRPVQVN
ncbi:MAG TPA: hypothetical protein VI999_03460 [Thermoplasmata archaeon]|nr:hypothetical protein [Thermoplasmata archaeon]